MKGVIFNVFEDFVVSAHGEDVFDDIVAATTLQTTEPFVGPGTYPATDLLALVGTAVAHLGIEVDDALRAFGRHAFPALAGSVSTLMEGLDDAHTFLTRLESVVHTEVRKLDAQACPARFVVDVVSPTELVMHYRSPLGLFALVEGLLDGVGDWFDVELSCERLASAGTNGSFRIRFPEDRRRDA